MTDDLVDGDSPDNPELSAGERDDVDLITWRHPAPPELVAGGLDLAIASSIVRQHNGRVRIEPQAGGHNVILELPAYSADMVPGNE